ncbi:peptidase C14 [Nemania sp. FL0031]|nr:peptidase C14 [Nemania sp. FL0031]
MPPPRQPNTSLEKIESDGLCTLCQVYCPLPENNTTTDIDIIAIHGLDTRSPETWEFNTQEGMVNWLANEHMLQTKVGSARIFTCNWPAGLFLQSVPTTLEESAKSLRDSILQHLNWDGQSFSDRPILFIASCLGGVILMKALDMDRPQGNDSSRSPLISATRGIIFLATPFLGTAFKDMPYLELKVWASLSGKEVTSLIDYTRDPPILRGLVEQFISLSKAQEYHVWAFWEAGKTSLLSKIYLGWTFSERIYYVWPGILIFTLALDAFLPWLPWILVLWLVWLLHFPVFKPKQLVDETSATAFFLPSSRLCRRHVLMNKFKDCADTDYCIVARKIEEILGKIREGRMIDKADAYILKEHYTADRLKIERLSGDNLSMEQCYINLAIIKNLDDDKSYAEEGLETGDPQSSPFSLTTRLKIESPDRDIQVELVNIFDETSDVNTAQPRRILIRGRAGVGKTTLCKKIVHDFIYRHTWKNMFDRILWVPLRILKQSADTCTLDSLLHRHFFPPTEEGKIYAKELEKALRNTKYARTLFVLDGLDEVSEGLDRNSEMYSFLKFLLTRPNVIITSRPLARLPDDLRLDLELETIGFYPNQVQEYIKNVSPESADDIQSFLHKRPLVGGLLRIPIQLDALCFSWAQGFDGHPLETMTEIYEAISTNIWRKESWRFDKRSKTSVMGVEPVRIQKDHEPIVKFLECLAFNGIYSNVVDFQQNHRNTIMSIRDTLDTWLGKFSLGDVSFLRTSDPSAAESERSYHFLHLTYQEFFAARYFARQWRDKKDLEIFEAFGNRDTKRVAVSVNTFLQENKYSIRYDIVWRFTTGLLEPDETHRFFEAVEQQPIDLLGPTHQRFLSEDLCQKFTNISNTKTDGNIQYATARALERRLDLTKIDVTALTAAPKDKNIITKSSAALVLQERLRLGMPGDATLIETLKNQGEDKYIQSLAIQALGGQSPEPIVKNLVTIIRDKNERHDVRCYAAETLSRQKFRLPKDHVVALSWVLQDEDENIRSSAVKALSRQSNLPEATLTPLEELFRSGGMIDRFAVLGILKRQPSIPKSTITSLTKVLKHENEGPYVCPLGRKLKFENLDRRIQLVMRDAKSITLPEEALEMVRYMVTLLRKKDTKLFKNTMGLFKNTTDILTLALKTILGDPKLWHMIPTTIKSVLESEGFDSKATTLLYGILIYRSFNEQLCLYIEGDSFAIGLPGGLEKYKAPTTKLLDIIYAGRQLHGADSDLLWVNPFEKAAG